MSRWVLNALFASATVLSGADADNCTQLHLPAGLPVNCRLRQTISGDTVTNNESFHCESTSDVRVAQGGPIAVPRFSILVLKVVDVQRAGRVKGVSKIDFALTFLYFPDGSLVPVSGQISGIEPSASTKANLKPNGRIEQRAGFLLWRWLPFRGEQVKLRVEGVITIKPFDTVTIDGCTGNTIISSAEGNQ